MPKLKTLKSAAKRFRKKPSGKVRFKHAQARHLLSCKSQNTKRTHRKGGYLDTTETARVNRQLPYG